MHFSINTSKMNLEQLYKQIQKKNTLLCVGLDSDPEKFPSHIKELENPIFEFNKAIIDATAEYCVAYKPNIAFYEAEGLKGWEQLKMTVDYIRSKYPDLFLIADAKRGDIGNTAARYAKAFFKEMDFDAITVAPYMGADSITPFLEYEGKWVIVLALTSNKSAEQFETLQLTDGMPLYEKVIKETISTIDTKTNGDSLNRLMFVIGATRPEKLKEIREFCPDHFLLVPGVGAQGGTMEEVAENGLNSKAGLLVNSSRGIIFASNGTDFAKKAAEAAKAMRLK